MPSEIRSKKGRVALVTGSAGGLGQAFCTRLAEEGATVVCVDRVDMPDFAKRLISAGASDALFLNVDISDQAQVVSLSSQVLERFGRCDIILNNAGVVPHTMLAEITLADWRQAMAVNIDAMFMICQALVPSMVERGYGRIVNTASAILGAVIGGYTNYMASKGAVVGFTRALASELGESGVTVNCIAPALTRVPRTEEELSQTTMFETLARLQAIKRVATPDDYTGTISFLTSDDAAFMTGQTIIVDGGFLRSI